MHLKIEFNQKWDASESQRASQVCSGPCSSLQIPSSTTPPSPAPPQSGLTRLEPSRSDLKRLTPTRTIPNR
ncbi:hypothetical protein E2C01_017257 [Portunus trituberculatus]|uniref:Uncharacterized protein n=1 Tax=Portunus trituberculatus TaxID=210409 RepID=A0A5B7DRE7_PORTR|nr:hypothetical protein [Portunus trituberculatus]